jgi:NADH dehydrogenase (ubiquinone) 1 beta subcomplex subunit 5
MLSRLLRLGNHGLGQRLIITKRWSGHNAMEITPSNIDMKFTTNWMHFYIIIGAVPVAVITTIINIKANPELSEIPEGYEPRHWEYFKHPITRFMAKYLYNPNELEREIMLGFKQDMSHEEIMKKVSQKCEKVMKFYNDHRSFYFTPFFADYFRSGRDDALFRINFEATQPNTILDLAYEPDTKTVPTEGYPPNFDPANPK